MLKALGFQTVILPAFLRGTSLQRKWIRNSTRPLLAEEEKIVADRLCIGEGEWDCGTVGGEGDTSPCSGQHMSGRLSPGRVVASGDLEGAREEGKGRREV